MPHDVYLRIETVTSVLVDCKILPLSEALESAQSWLVFFILYIGFSLALLVWALANFLFYKDLAFFSSGCFGVILNLLYPHA